MANVVMSHIGFKVLSAVTMRSTVFLDVTQYSLVDIINISILVMEAACFLEKFEISYYMHGVIVLKIVAFIKFSLSLLLFHKFLLL
jgi:hypothetical protein